MRRRLDPETAHWRLTRQRAAWLCLATTLVIAPHVVRLPVWISALFLLLCLWRLWRVHRGEDRAPSRWLVALVGLAVLPGIYLSYGTVTGRQAGVALLSVLAASKLLETRTLRDAFVLIYLGFFLIVTGFLFDQSMWMAGYMLLVMVVMIATLTVLSTDNPFHNHRRYLTRSAVLLAQAAPLALALFVLFPRIPGPIWGLPHDAHSAVTGLSDQMSPGDISQLTLSNAVAFRVHFDGDAPAKRALYWRGPVLETTDGRRWTHTAGGLRHVLIHHDAPQALRYSVTLEPGTGYFLPALEYAVEVPRGALLTASHSLRSQRRIRGRFQYQAASLPSAHIDATRAPGERALQLAAGAHPRARQLAAAWREQDPNQTAIIERALALFASEGFRYTLTPTRLPGDAVDDFLFTTREGFCEHFAAAFTVLMRSAGIPARVVTGYQGGEFNPMGDYWVVRQRDAHAWSEVWLEGRGWVRIDPTAVVAPQRIDRGLTSIINAAGENRQLDAVDQPGQLGLLKHLANLVDLTQARWNTWVLAYGPKQQRSLLGQAGLGRDIGDFALLSVAALTLLMAALSVWLLRQRKRPDANVYWYQRFCRKLARAGIVRNNHEGPQDFADRVKGIRPELSNDVAAITTAYIALRYQGTDKDIAELRTLVRAFKA